MDLKDKFNDITLNPQGVAELMFDVKICLDIMLEVMLECKLIDRKEFEMKYKEKAGKLVEALDRKQRKADELKELFMEELLKNTDPKGNA
jgi:hypothetical protein